MRWLVLVALIGCHGDTFIRGGSCAEDTYGYTISSIVQVALEPGDVVTATLEIDGGDPAGLDASQLWDCYHWTPAPDEATGCRRDPGQVDEKVNLGLSAFGNSTSELPPSVRVNATLWVTTSAGREAADSTQFSCVNTGN